MITIMQAQNSNKQCRDLTAISDAIAEARLEKNKPSIICLKTTIGFGSKQQGTHGVHGARGSFPIQPSFFSFEKSLF